MASLSSVFHFTQLAHSPLPFTLKQRKAQQYELHQQNICHIFFFISGQQDIFKGLENSTLCKNRTKSDAIDPSEQEMQLISQSLGYGGRDFRLTASEPTLFMKYFPAKIASPTFCDSQTWWNLEDYLICFWELSSSVLETFTGSSFHTIILCH